MALHWEALGYGIHSDWISLRFHWKTWISATLSIYQYKYSLYWRLKKSFIFIFSEAGYEVVSRL